MTPPPLQNSGFSPRDVFPKMGTPIYDYPQLQIMVLVCSIRAEASIILTTS